MNTNVRQFGAFYKHENLIKSITCIDSVFIGLIFEISVKSAISVFLNVDANHAVLQISYIKCPTAAVQTTP